MVSSIITRFKRLFANKDDVKDLTWQAYGRNCNGMLCLPVDSSQWKKINCLFSDFGKETRNLRLGLATNRMDPFDDLSTEHSSWPIYDDFRARIAKKWHKCLSKSFDWRLKKVVGWGGWNLWWESIWGIQLHAMVFCTINDFLAYENLSGYNVNEHRAWLIYVEDISYIQLKYEKKKEQCTLGINIFSNLITLLEIEKAFNGS